MESLDKEQFWVFAYGSLVWKPPPFFVERIHCHVRGVVRRFWQSSNDHRGAGTPENPGRVVTLISREFWETLDDPHPYGDDDVVWGVAYRIHPFKVKEAKAYLDEREKNGYSAVIMDFYPRSSKVETKKCLAYIGKPDNPAFTGPQDPDSLAKDIARSSGPSGTNSEYLYLLHKHIKRLCAMSYDHHVEDLVKRVRVLEGLPEEEPEPPRKYPYAYQSSTQ